MEEENGGTPPFWLQTSDTLRRADRHRRRPSSLFLNSGVLLVLLLLAAALFVVLITPSILSLASQIFRPNSVKKGWDSLNLVLVLFAIVCGFLSRKNDEEETPVAGRAVPPNVLSRERSNSSSTPRNWYEWNPDHRNQDRNPDRKVYSSSSGFSNAATGMFMRRNSSSYPDLRQGLMNGEDRWRFYDDTEVNDYRVWGSDHLHTRPSLREEVDSRKGDLPTAPPRSPPEPSPTEAVAAEEKVEDLANAASEMEKLETPPLVTPPAQKIRRRARRSSEPLAPKGNRENADSDEPQSSPPPPISDSLSEQERRRDDRKRGGGSSSATKEFLTSLYHQRKRKKKHRHKSLENFDTLLDLSGSSSFSSAALHAPRSPPPPPPPPPPSMFKNLFSSRRGKTKRSHSVPPPHPPPPPPLTSTARALEIKTKISIAQSHKPLLPVKTGVPDIAEEDSSSGTQSPLIPIPPPPPPPPFKIPALKFAVQGDFVRLLSDRSSRSGSPDPDQLDASPTEESTAVAAAVAGDATAALFCPSPDVDTEADSFIAKFRAGLKLEKINSINEKRGLGLSGLGPRPRSGPDSTRSPEKGP